MRFSKHVGWNILIAGAGAVVMFLAAQSALAAPGIVASKHDFSTSGPAGSTYKSTTQTQVCVYCHAPHNTSVNSVLWNRAANTASYTLYANVTGFSSLNETPVQPGPVSKLCLSCHDGTVAVDSFGGAAGTATLKITGNANLGGAGGLDLANDHPIGFVYNAALATSDGGLKDPSTATIPSGPLAGGTIAAKMLRSGGELECSSCHDVHNSAGSTAVQAKLLKVTTAGSALCLTCHNK